MYTINNIVQSALRKSDDRLSILVLNEHYDDYIKRFEYLDHDFYLANDMYGVPQWASPLGFNNIHIANRLQDHCLSHIDAIVVFNRAGLWERAKQLSDTWHIPLIVIDITCSANHVPLPFFATVAVNNPPQLFQRNGHVSVGITEDVANSWQSPYQSLSMHIPIAPMPIQRKENADKILIDTSLPQEYIDSLPFVASPDKFTTDPTEAKIYLHLWRNVTPLMIDCMASDIPVITMSDQDFVDIINKQACVLIQDLQIVGQTTFLEEIAGFPQLGKITERAKEYANQTNMEEFKNSWESVLRYATNNAYVRGIA